MEDNAQKSNCMEDVLRRIQLPSEILKSYHNFGVKDLYDWQVECLFSTGIWDGGHLIYCAPTSGGKTLVAELLLLKTAILLKKTVIFVLPYVSLVTEKEIYLKKLLARYNRSRPLLERVKVRGFFGDHCKGSRSYKENVLVCTIEKANQIFNSLITRGRGHQLGCVVFDEVHSLGSSFNGHLLEILISKIKYMEFTAQQSTVRVRWTLEDILDIPLLDGDQHAAAMRLLQSSSSSSGSAAAVAARATMSIKIQMIALSATMGNVQQLSDWLGGRLYTTAFRPIPLVERIKAGNEVLDSKGVLLGCIPPLNKVQAAVDTDHTVFLSQQALGAGRQVLVFCPSKAMCLQTCRVIVDVLTSSTTLVGSTGNMHVWSHSIALGASSEATAAKRQDLLAARHALLAALQSENSRCSLDSILKASIVHGIAYHHAGLSAGARSLVESGFRSGTLSILAATSTLAAGVNLPAGRVLIRSLNIGKDFLSVMQYKQMCGRAGRMGQGSNGVGESFLLVKASEKARAVTLSSQPMPHVRSQLHPRRDGGNALLKALLEAVGLGLCSSVQQAVQFVQQTLLYRQAACPETGSADTAAAQVSKPQDIISMSLSIVVFLINCRMIDSSERMLYSANPLEHADHLIHLCMHDPRWVSMDEGSSDDADRCTLRIPLKITRFGKAILQSNTDPDDAIVMYESLLRAQDGLHLESPLHLLYLVAPLDHQLQPSFRRLLSIYESSRSSSSKHPLLASIFDSIGIDFSALNRWCVSAPTRAAIDICSNAVRLHSLAASTCDSSSSSSTYRHMSREDWQVLCRCKRIWAAMVLQGLVDGRPMTALGKEFDVDVAIIETLLRDSLMMISKVIRFCAEIGWSSMERIFTDFKPQLLAISADQCSEELQSLMAVPMMSSKMARVLHQASVKDRESFLDASAESLAQLLQLSIGFELQELERVEIQLEQSEQSVVGGSLPLVEVEEGTAAAASASIQTSAATTSSSVMPLSRDEHMRLRLVALISSLQFAARQADEQRLMEVDDAACDAMAAVHQYDHLRSGEEGHDLLHNAATADVSSDGDLYSDSSEGNLSTRPDDAADSEMSDDTAAMDSEPEMEEDLDEHVSMDAYSPSEGCRLDAYSRQGAVVEAEELGRGPQPLTAHSEWLLGPNINARHRADRSPLAKAAKVIHEAYLAPLNNPFETIGEKMDLIGCESIAEVEVDDVPTTLSVWPSTDRQQQQVMHKITISPLQPLSASHGSMAIAGGDMALSWALSDVDLNALMEELESSGVLELSSSSSQQLQHHPIDLLYGVHTSHASGRGIDAALHFPPEGQHYVYYPMQPPMDEVRRQHSAVNHPASSDSPSTRALGLPIMPFDEDFRSPAKAIAAAALLSKYSNSGYKISVYSSYARKDVEVDQAHATDESYLFNRNPAHDDGVRVEACNDRSDGMASDGEWGDEVGAVGVEGIGVDPSYLTAADDDCENSRDSNVSCSDVLKESFENSVTITTSNSKQLYVPLASTLYSPYATPFTPSKVRTPGMYLYYPLWQSDRRQRPGRCAVDGFARLVNGTAPTGDSAARSGGRRVDRLGPQYPSEVVSSETSFGVRDVRSDAHCMQFLKQLKRSRCVSFELLFRPIPSAWLAYYKAPQETSISMSRIDGKSAAAKLVDKCANVCSWTPYVSWACIKLSSVTCSVSDHYLESSLQQSSDGSLKRNMFRHPHVLVGAALCFGDEFGYYLPLPTPLPLVPNPYTTTSQDHYHISSSMEAFPSSIREAIATYVGFGNILNKCPLLEAYFSQQDQKDQHITESLQMKSVCLAEMSSNPLFLVSRGWCHSTRAALLMAWRKGACIEWKLFADIMRNANLTKVAIHVKSKMVVLRERDVLVEGPVEDPSIAQTILTTTQWPEPLRPSSHAGGKSIVSIKVPKLKASSAQTAPSLELLLNGKKIACFRAVAVMRAMAKMEEQLRQCSMIDLFRNIEMPLQYCSADAELGGIKVDPAFFSRLRQGLMDRKEAIQSYCRVFCGQAFNVDSHVDVSKVKKDIVSKIRHGVPTAATAAKTGEKDSIEAVVTASHPFMRLISEYRSHVRTLPLCSSILGNRYFDRVRPVYNTIGTETGRVIIVNPPLQQVPKACQYLHCDRLSVHEELCSSSCDPMAAHRMISAFNARHGTATRSDTEWVHVVSLGGPPHLEAGSGWVHSFSTGKLVHILDLSVSAPPHASADHSTAALVDLWRAAGFDYSDTEADSIRQVLVEFPSDRDNTTRPDAYPSVGVRRYAYPADKVYRLTAGIKPDPSEFESIRNSLSQPVQWWFLQQSVSQAAFSKPTTASSSLPPGCSSRQHVAVNVRSGFQASKGFVLLAADYCQIELRILSHFSGDPSLLAAFHRVGFDVFKAIAASWLGSRGGRAAADSEVTDEERNQVKQICYALIYGAGPQLVADQAGISVDRAKAMMKDFLDRYPGVQRFLHLLKQRSKKIGYVETLLGRRRYLSGLGSGDKKLRARAERQAVNTLCQGSAADLIKLAMINIHCRLAQQSVPLNFRRPRQHPGAGLYRLLDDVRPVLQVHDELVFEVREEHLSAVAAIVKDCMENAVVLNVPLLVKLSIGSSWGSLSPLSLTAAAAHLQDTMITAPHPPVSLYQTAVMSSSIHSTIDAVDNASGQLMEASSHAVVARDLFGRD